MLKTLKTRQQQPSQSYNFSWFDTPIPDFTSMGRQMKVTPAIAVCANTAFGNR